MAEAIHPTLLREEATQSGLVKGRLRPQLPTCGPCCVGSAPSLARGGQPGQAAGGAFWAGGL